MFDRNSSAYRQLITDIAEAVFFRIDARMAEIDARFASKRRRELTDAPLPMPSITPKALATLTPRERRVLEGIVRGGSNKAIAREMGISDRTVEVHRANVMEKLGVHGTAALVSAAIQAGILPSPPTEEPKDADAQ